MSAFRRYTNLAATIYLLRQRYITLLNPATWDDRNDAWFMAEYKRYMKAKTVLALCFAERPETYHHWKVFSHGSDGVCIEFDKEKLLSAFTGEPQIQADYVKYKMLKDIANMQTVQGEQLPFLKRQAFEDEAEFRIVYVDTEKKADYQNYAIEIDWINRITLSPWMAKALADSVKATLRSIKGCSGLSIYRSSLIDNETWKNLTRRVPSHNGRHSAVKPPRSRVGRNLGAR
jgi:hypothetical protein